MMFSRFVLVGLASLVLACAMALVFYKVQGSSSEKKVKTRRIVVATADLLAGARVKPQDLRIATLPADLMPQNCFEKTEDVQGRVVTNLIVKDEPVVPNRLAAPGSAPGLAPMIPAGYRAVSVRVNDVIGVAGFIQPGMRVDVLATGRIPNSEDSVTRTVLQNVVVLSAGQVLQPEPKGQVINAQVVTLQVRPEEAEVLTLTSGEARIQLVLRNSSDGAMATTPGAHLKTIYNSGSVAPEPNQNRRVDRSVMTRPKATVASTAVVPPTEPPLPHRTIEVIRGNVRSDVAAPRDSEQKNEPEKKKITRWLHASYQSA
jgi:pilus assembly protein CpaB